MLDATAPPKLPLRGSASPSSANWNQFPWPSYVTGLSLTGMEFCFLSLSQNSIMPLAWSPTVRTPASVPRAMQIHTHFLQQPRPWKRTHSMLFPPLWTWGRKRVVVLPLGRVKHSHACTNFPSSSHQLIVAKTYTAPSWVSWLDSLSLIPAPTKQSRTSWQELAVQPGSDC